MSSNRTLVALSVALFGVLGTGSVALAATAADEAAAISSATVTSAQAIATVEAKSGGKVVELQLTATASAPIYNVTAQLTDGTESNFIVDALTGAVTPSTDVASGNSDDGETADAGSDDQGAGEAAGDSDGGSNEDGSTD
jgi:hypothetical protein